MKKLSAPLFLSMICFLASCTKDEPAPSTAFEGTYKLTSMSAKTNTTLKSGEESSVTLSDYTTTKNGGTINFANGVLTANALTYTVDTYAKYEEYEGSTIVDSASFPFTFTLPPSSSVGQYKLIGSDSIYFPQGGVSIAADGSSSYGNVASGGRYSIDGNKLTIIQQYAKDSTYSDDGIMYKMKQSAVASIVMEKQ